MIGGVSGGYPVLVPADRGGDRRERAAGLVSPAPFQSPSRREDQADIRRSQPQNLPANDLQLAEESDLFQQRVEARAQAQAARLERDDSSTLPRQNQQAMQTYGEVFSTRDDSGVDLVGLDLRV